MFLYTFYIITSQFKNFCPPFSKPAPAKDGGGCGNNASSLFCGRLRGLGEALSPPLGNGIRHLCVP
jgi:hypothetical protein